ncbi:LuxR family transcriptional regulator [Symbioplanes lichenis]|uniref:LuxR family transcriptional regulator n=1 Tax=Symbioplanes lichenis TaxID=1629072 RepID=UPI0027386AC6|nr:LuxR family transcriptional regulator [Actinoplanes lichenis]
MKSSRCQVRSSLLGSPSDPFTRALLAGEIRDCRLALSVSAWLTGAVRTGLGLAAEAAGNGCDGQCAPFAEAWHALLLIRVRELAGAARLLVAADDQASDDVDAAWAVARAEFALASGETAEAVVRATVGMEVAERSGAYALLPNLHAVLAVNAVRQSDMVAALQYARLLGDDALIGRTAYVPGQSAWASALVVEAATGPASAAHLAERLIVDDRLGPELLAAQPAAAAWLVRVARGAGNEELAARCAERAGTIARESWGFRSLHAAALHAEGLAEKSPEKLRAAAALHLDRWAGASAAEDQAALISRQRGGRDAAVAQLRQAATRYGEAGAPRDLARVTSKLRDLGVRSGRALRPVRRNGHRVGFLTDTEFSVADLVSQGLTNDQVGQSLYISGHTVAFHLKKIFRKLEVSSRVELAGAWGNLTADQRDAV